MPPALRNFRVDADQLQPMGQVRRVALVQAEDDHPCLLPLPTGNLHSCHFAVCICWPNHYTRPDDLRHRLMGQEAVWPKAVHRVVTERINPEQAVEEAIARIKQILSE
jgi:hypothetical protein